MTRKTIYLIVGIIMISSLSAFSQNFKFGLVAGIDFSKTHLTKEYFDFQVYHPMIAYNFNGYIGYKRSEYWGLSVEPGFIQKGARQKFMDNYARYNLNYIQLPILLDYYLSDKVYASIGPELNYLINARVKSKDDYNDISFLYDKKFELAGLVGINYRIMEKLDIGLRYNHGLTSIIEVAWTTETGEKLGESKEYNQYFQFIVKFKI